MPSYTEVVAEELAEKIFAEVRDYVQNFFLPRARRRLTYCINKKVPYEWGGETIRGLDCSGLIAFCYPDVFPRTVQSQFDLMRQSGWVFQNEDIRYAERGDICFLYDGSEISHVGIISGVSLEKITVIHASQKVGCVTKDHYLTSTDPIIFKSNFTVYGIGKIRQFLMDWFIEMMLQGRNVFKSGTITVK